MSRYIKILSVLLVVQIAIIVGLTFKGQEGAVFVGSEPLLTTDFKQIDKVVINSSSKKLELVKVDGSWQLPEKLDFPASPSKLEELTERLSGLKKSWPAGKTDIAAKQFSVTDEKFERKVVFYKGSQVQQTLYVGSSPSFRKVHARVDEDKNTYSVDLNAHDFPTDLRSWYDHDYFKQPRADVTELDFQTVKLEGKDGQFTVTDLNENEETDIGKVSNLLVDALNPSFEDVLSKGETPPEGYSPRSRYSLKTKSGKTVEFKFYSKQSKQPSVVSQPGGGKNKKPTIEEKLVEEVVLLVSGYPYVFKVDTASVKDLFAVSRSELVKPKDAKEEHSAVDTDTSVTEPASKNG